jgi:hypothetical protein
MKKFTILAAVAALSATGAMAETWSGTISDAKCGKAHADASEKSTKCVEACVKGGQAAVFVVGDKVLKFADASKEKVMPHLGHKVEIDGSLSGDTITVKSIKMSKAS